MMYACPRSKAVVTQEHLQPSWHREGSWGDISCPGCQMVQLHLQAGQVLRQSGFARLLLLMLVLLATSMIIGDGVLTPAISVISAISGIEQASPNITNSKNALPPPTIE